MKTTVIALLLMGVAVTLAADEENDISLRAPSSFVNCGCQCDSYTWRDKYGRVQGNCRSADNTGARWCYVAGRSSCTDLRRSQRLDGYGRSRAWSYEACATPACGGGNGIYNGGNYGAYGNMGGNYFGGSGGSYGTGSSLGGSGNYGGGLGGSGGNYGGSLGGSGNYGGSLGGSGNYGSGFGGSGGNYGGSGGFLPNRPNRPTGTYNNNGAGSLGGLIGSILGSRTEGVDSDSVPSTNNEAVVF